MRRFRVTYNPTIDNNKGGYPSPPSNTAIDYVGWVNPKIFFTLKPQDRWIFEVPKPDNIIEITTADEANIQSIIDNAPNYTRIIFKANSGLPTTYKTGNLKPNNGKIIQLFGEKDALGRKLITIDNSVVLTGFTLDGSLWKKTSVSAPSNIEVSPDYNPNPNGFYSQLPFLLLVDGVPFDPVASTAEVDTEPNDKFYYDNSNGDLWLGFNPTGKEIRWATNDNFFSSGGQGANGIANNPADNVVVRGFIVKYLAGTNQFGSSIGGRTGNWGLSENYRPMQRWLIMDVEVQWCRAGGIRNKFGSHTINCTTSNCGGGLMTAGVIGQNSWDAGYRPHIEEWSIFRGNRREFNGWIMAEVTSGLNQKLNRSYQTLHIDHTSYKDGKTNVRGLQSDVSGEWFDNCYYIVMRGCRYIENGGSGIFMEISYYGDIQFCDFIRCDSVQAEPLGNAAGGIYNSTSRYMKYENNYFEILPSIATSNKARPLHLRNSDRGTGYLGLWESRDFSFSKNRIKYLGDRGRIQFTASASSDTLVPSYLNWTDKNIVIQENIYENAQALANRYWGLNSGSSMSLAALQALLDNNGNPFEWEKDTILI